MPITLDDLRRYAVARTLFAPTTLGRAIARLGFVQADPIRAPARAQDLTLRHRVKNYRAGDLERRYARLGVEEDFFVNYGFLPRAHHALMHPRTPRTVWSPARWKQAHAVLAFVAERGEAHPREVDAHFAHGKVANWFGGSTNASTQLLDGMHYRGLLRIARR
ncbi:MAG: winged helix DNA-binding domain-containing protein, partial [Burkholderiales bacterium]|nr:winged helix DNA-binding domain-containing protein [Burkholderiales bacterium]